MQAYDVAIVGGGITGCALAFELGRYRVKTALLERSNDVAAGALRLIGVHPDDPTAVSGSGIFVKGLRND